MPIAFAKFEQVPIFSIYFFSNTFGCFILASLNFSEFKKKKKKLAYFLF